MIVFVGLLLLAEGVIRDASCLPSESESADASTRVAYERAIDRTVSEYHAQRKAVMDRYYARQREIVEKFSRQNAQPRPLFDVTAKPPTNGNPTTLPIDSTTVNGSVTSHEGGERIEEAIASEAGSDRREDGNSSVSWIYRSGNWNPRDLENASDADLQSENSNALERSVDGTKVAGYYKLGEFKGSEDEKVLYQHNLGVGLKGSSQLDATFEVVLEGSFAITIVEAFPYANTRANLSWVDGGPGSDYVKLKLRGYENEGFSYTVKVWGIPK